MKSKEKLYFSLKSNELLYAGDGFNTQPQKKSGEIVYFWPEKWFS